MAAGSSSAVFTRRAVMLSLRPRAAIFCLSAARYSGVALEPVNGSSLVGVSKPVWV